MRADLHAHSTASDGTVAPRELVELAHEAGLDVLALTDHDSVAGVAEAAAAARAAGLLLIPAVELSASLGTRELHVLGYFVDADDARLQVHLEDLRAARYRRAESMVAALRDGGYEIELADVLALSNGGSVGRSHVAAALARAGHAENVSDAFGRLIGRGRPFYVAKDSRSAEEAVSIITAAGGIPVLAHPGVGGVTDVLSELVAAGMRGIEAYHPDHTDEQRAWLEAFAEERGLLVTGGSDYHGPGAPNPTLGAIDVPSRHVEALLAAGEGASADRPAHGHETGLDVPTAARRRKR